MLHPHKGHAGIRHDIGEKLLEGLQAVRRGADADDGEAGARPGWGLLAVAGHFILGGRLSGGGLGPVFPIGVLLAGGFFGSGHVQAI